jgi:hypothetical protein
MHIVQQKRRIEKDPSLTIAERESAIQVLKLNGITVDDLGLNFSLLNFTLPASTLIELCQGGQHRTVTIYNMKRYLHVNF